MKTAGAVLFGLLAAASFAGAALLQQHAARSVPEHHSLRLSLLLQLVRRPIWVGGGVAMVGGYLLQAVALGLGPVALVQPLISTELAIAVPLSIVLGHGRGGLREWGGTALTVAGVAVFVAAASPAPGRPDPGSLLWVAILLPAFTVMAAVATIASGRRGPARANLLGVDAGIAFGLLAVLTKAAAHLAGQGTAAFFGNFQVYAIVAVGILGFVCSQSAYQAASLASSLPFIVVVEPTTAVLIGATALGEHLALAGGAALFEAVGIGAGMTGVVLLTRSPVVLSVYESRGGTHGEAGGRHRGRRGQAPKGADEASSATGRTLAPPADGPRGAAR